MCLLGIVLPIQIVKFCTVPSSWYFAIVSIPQSSKQNGVVMRRNVDGCQNVLNVSFVDSSSSIRFKMSNTSQNFWGEKKTLARLFVSENLHQNVLVISLVNIIV